MSAATVASTAIAAAQWAVTQVTSLSDLSVWQKKHEDATDLSFQIVYDV